MSTGNDELVEQLDRHWTNQARPRLDGLTDAEYRWEPVDGACSIRPRREARATAVGRGDVVIDFDVPEPTPAPVTTIAWRMGHLSIGVFGARAANHFGEAGSVDYEATEWPSTLAEIALLRDLYTHRSTLAAGRS